MANALELGQIIEKERGLHHIGATVKEVALKISKRDLPIGHLRELPEIRRILSGNGHSRGKSPETAFSSIVSDKPLPEAERINELDLYASLHLLKIVYKLNGIKTPIRHELFAKTTNDAKIGLIGKGYKVYIEALVDTCQRAQYSK